MRSKRTIQICLIILFVVMIGIPVIAIHWEDGGISAEENRTLAAYPTLNTLSEIRNREIMEECEAWIDDHIGGRGFFRRIYTHLFHRMLKISTEKKVIFGKDDWLFYAAGSNLDIAKGTYPLTEEKILQIQRNQDDILAYYNRQNINYHLLLTPSKVSIYPEYLPFLANDGSPSPVDIVERIINTDDEKTAISVKRGLLNAKQKEQKNLFFKTDSHWNAIGSYYAYVETITQLRKEEPIKVDSFLKDSILCDLNKMLGLNDPADEEIDFIPDYKWLSEKASDAIMNEIVRASFKNHGSLYYEPIIYINQNRLGSGTVLLYGDSMMGENLWFPRYLAEHYEKVIVTRLRWIEPELEKYTGATDIIYQTTERMILPALIDAIAPKFM